VSGCRPRRRGLTTTLTRPAPWSTGRGGSFFFELALLAGGGGGGLVAGALGAYTFGRYSRTYLVALGSGSGQRRPIAPIADPSCSLPRSHS
jgi:hypothetical protein